MTEPPSPRKHTYGQILKSSVWVGGSSMLNMGIGMVRTKVMAVILGPAGVGLMGLYGSVIDVALSIAGMGVNTSGVRQIAEASGSGNPEKAARTAIVLRRTSLFLGILGAVFLAATSRQVSALTFGTERNTAAVALLSLAVFFRIVSEGQGALIQGMRRIADLAQMSVWATVLGTVLSIPLVYFFREDGIVPALMAGAAAGLLVSWWYRRRVKIPYFPINLSQVWREQSALLKLGFAFMASALMMSGAAYAIKIMVSRQIGFEAAGLYQSAWNLGGIYIGFILQAMGADFYPRLVAVVKDNNECNRTVNEQAQVSLLLAGPGVVATLTFAPLVIALFYTPKFHPAVELLRWLCLGMALRVISWPMAFIMLAKGAQNVFFWSELAWTSVYLGCAWVCVRFFGLNGTGIAFFLSYIFHCVMVYVIVRRLSDFRWSVANVQTTMLYLPLIGVVFGGFYFFPPFWATVIGIIAIVGGSLFSLRVLLSLVSLDRIPSFLRAFLVRFRFASGS